MFHRASLIVRAFRIHITPRRFILVLMAGASAYCASSRPASALMLHVRHAHRVVTISYMPTHRYMVALRHAATPTVRRTNPAAHAADKVVPPDVDYNGGPVMPANENYTVYWIPKGRGFEFPGQYKEGVNQYFRDLQAATGTGATIDSVASQYNDLYGNLANYNSTFTKEVVDEEEYPNGGKGHCAAAAKVEPCLTNEDIEEGLKKLVLKLGLPTDLETKLTHEYFVLTPPKVYSCSEAAAQSCSPIPNRPIRTEPMNPGYCAYHDNIPVQELLVTKQIIYSYDPYVSVTRKEAMEHEKNKLVECDDGYHPNGLSDGAIEGGLAHEHMESITDPIPSTGWEDTTAKSVEGYTPGEEVSDKCNPGKLAGKELALPENYYGEFEAIAALPFPENGYFFATEMEKYQEEVKKWIAGGKVGKEPQPVEYLGQYVSGRALGEESWELPTGGGAVPWSQLINGHLYWYEGVWSNAGRTCRSQYESVTSSKLKLPVAKFNAHLVNGSGFEFDATESEEGTSEAGVAEPINHYVWQFNDPTNPKKPPVPEETFGPKTTHKFSAPGLYTVALTVVTANGSTNGTAHLVLVPPKWFVNGALLAEGVRNPIISYGKLALTPEVENPIPTECEDAVAGSIENPVGGGAAKEVTEAFDAYNCHNTECEIGGGHIGVIVENENALGLRLQISWPGELTEGVHGTNRLATSNVAVYVHCQANGGYTGPTERPGEGPFTGLEERNTAEYNSGTKVTCTTKSPGFQRPKLINGTSLSKPAETEFDSEAGKLECGVFKALSSKKLAVVGYNRSTNVPSIIALK